MYKETQEKLVAMTISRTGKQALYNIYDIYHIYIKGFIYTIDLDSSNYLKMVKIIIIEENN